MKHRSILFVLLSITISGCSTISDNPQRRLIVVNQIGYINSLPKNIFALEHNEDDRLALVDNANGKTISVFDLDKCDDNSVEEKSVCSLRFDDFSKTGSYYFKSSHGRSENFSIGSTIYKNAIKILLRSYYLQRCGIDIDDKLTQVYHKQCHINSAKIARSDSVYKADSDFDETGGWHDAGDYGKYISTTAISVGQILSLYSWMPDYFSGLNLQIPESHNAEPDVLDEMQVGLDWMLKMLRSDGAVYRKVGGKSWPPLVPPESDNQQRYIYGIATPDTAKFAATLAIASRVYSTKDESLSQRYLNAATKAWNFLQTTDQQYIDWEASDDSGSGPYQENEYDQEVTLKTDSDDRLWAAIELYLATGKSQYHQFIEEHINDVPYNIYEWKNPAPLGMLNYLFSNNSSSDLHIEKIIEKLIITRAERLVKKIDNNHFGNANTRYIWGSNKMTAAEGITLFFAYKLSGKNYFLQAAVKQVDYLLGANYFNQTFVTGLGQNPVKHVSHIFARANNIDIPGLFVGGPNGDAQAGIAPKNKGQLSYVDDERSYAVNEYAIDYNAALISLLALLESDSQSLLLLRRAI